MWQVSVPLKFPSYVTYYGGELEKVILFYSFKFPHLQNEDNRTSLVDLWKGQEMGFKKLTALSLT